MIKPKFPPDLKDFDWNWANYGKLIDEQYDAFVAQFITSSASFMGKPVAIRWEPKEDGREATFWHVVTRDFAKAGHRDADIERALRIHWIRPIIENYLDPAVTYFIHPEGTGLNRHYFWIRQCNYLVILEEKPKRFFIVTAFAVDQKYMLEDLEKKLEGYQKRMQ